MLLLLNGVGLLNSIGLLNGIGLPNSIGILQREATTGTMSGDDDAEVVSPTTPPEDYIP